MNNKLKNGLGLGACALAAVGGGILAVSNLCKPSTTYEIDMLEGASAYVAQCDGNNPQKAGDALSYALNAMDRASEKTTLEGLAEARRDIAGLADDVKNSPKLYPLVLEKAAERIENVADKNDRSNALLYLGGFVVLAGIAGGVVVLKRW